MRFVKSGFLWEATRFGGYRAVRQLAIWESIAGFFGYVPDR